MTIITGCLVVVFGNFFSNAYTTSTYNESNFTNFFTKCVAILRTVGYSLVSGKSREYQIGIFDVLGR